MNNIYRSANIIHMQVLVFIGAQISIEDLRSVLAVGHFFYHHLCYYPTDLIWQLENWMSCLWPYGVWFVYVSHPVLRSFALFLYSRQAPFKRTHDSASTLSFVSFNPFWHSFSPKCCSFISLIVSKFYMLIVLIHLFFFTFILKKKKNNTLGKRHICMCVTFALISPWSVFCCYREVSCLRTTDWLIDWWIDSTDWASVFSLPLKFSACHP